MAEEKKEEKKFDIWRDSPLRYAGYCNEVGEAFAPLFPRFLIPSYVASVSYVLGDTIDKTYSAYTANKEVNMKSVMVEAGDVLTWQMLASVIIPGLTIKAVAQSTTMACKSAFLQKKLPPSLLKYSPTAIGLFAIPFIIHPIDHAVDYFMDSTYRQYFSKTKD